MESATEPDWSELEQALADCKEFDDVDYVQKNYAACDDVASRCDKRRAALKNRGTGKLIDDSEIPY